MGEVVEVRLDMRKMMLDLFRQVLGIPNPAAGLAGARRLVMPKVSVKRLDQLDAFPERLAELFEALLVAMREVLETVIPVAITAAVAVITALAGRLVEILMRVVASFDELLDQQSGKTERFY
jgi:hypothetical protein